MTAAPHDLRDRALHWLRVDDARAKAAGVRADHQAMQETAGGWRLDAQRVIAEPDGLPGRPALPELVTAFQVPARSPHTPTGRAALLHAIAHIEFNAINLALDAVWRFPGMPADFYADWWRVAAEEALHFSLLAEHLEAMGHRYGDFPAHDGLWSMCFKTRQDIVGRMALVPRTLEARGLDATPLIQAKLAKAGDHRAVEILDIILRDEVGHVAIDNRWFRHLCDERALDATALYPELVKRYDAPRLRPPFNLDARRAAWFTDEELAWLAQSVG
jgi:uncharacterized ferritin-like protein (DUF455 family)